jgi:membrane protein DedA with SNARE-associated domain/rhodanese-related sulfurtransferase
VNSITELLARHELAALFIVVFAEQAGVPIPATPALLAAGALMADSVPRFAAALAVASVAGVAGDVIWYWLGLKYGRPMLSAICRLALEPASCARRATTAFGRRGAQVLLLAKFVPGFSTTAPPLAALFGVGPWRFLAWDMAGTTLWAGTFMLLGAAFREQLADLVAFGQRLGTGALLAAVALLAAYIAWKVLSRQRFLRRLRVERITPEELARLMEAREPLAIADLRHDIEVQADRVTIPGAVRFSPDELAERHHTLPKDREVVLYCSCPDEATSAGMALRLRARGITRIRPLAGGLDAWRSAGLPVVPITQEGVADRPVLET